MTVYYSDGKETSVAQKEEDKKWLEEKKINEQIAKFFGLKVVFSEFSRNSTMFDIKEYSGKDKKTIVSYYKQWFSRSFDVLEEHILPHLSSWSISTEGVVGGETVEKFIAHTRYDELCGSGVGHNKTRALINALTNMINEYYSKEKVEVKDLKKPVVKCAKCDEISDLTEYVISETESIILCKEHGKELEKETEKEGYQYLAEEIHEEIKQAQTFHGLNFKELTAEDGKLKGTVVSNETSATVTSDWKKEEQTDTTEKDGVERQGNFGNDCMAII
jgi:hypothetical protein